MILSASRRTDIPAFFGAWFLNRLLCREVLVRNPVNQGSVSRISLTPEDVDCFVFWTKDPKNFLEYLPRIDDLGHKYYFQFTLTPYGESIEPGLGSKDRALETFIELSELIGKDKVIWRYDPLLAGPSFGKGYHEDSFGKLCAALGGHTEKCIVSFVDEYPFLRKKFYGNGIRPPTEPEMIAMAGALKSIADRVDMPMASCCERIDLTALGIPHGKCVDDELVSRITRKPIRYKKDTGQRAECGCMTSRDIGSYNTCSHGCVYCYANRGVRMAGCDDASPMLCDALRGTERITNAPNG